MIVAAAIYLEEFAKKNRINDFIQTNINNLAGVPSIIYGMLGLAVFVRVLEPLTQGRTVLSAGLTLGLLTLPVVIISSQEAIRAVPNSLRQGGMSLGATKWQTVRSHVLPVAIPGILTGTIIGMSRALGEAAPLLMIGMVAFIVDIPQTLFDPATALPVQVFLWADSPERAFVERTSAAIMVLLAFLITMNALAVVLRRRFAGDWPSDHHPVLADIVLPGA